MKKLLLFIILLPVFLYCFYATSWSASYLMVEEDWKNQIVFTPNTNSDPQQIYEVDKFIYAFKIQPMISVICVLSFVGLISIITLWIINNLKSKTNKIAN
ncbi:DUF4306 domain-containing protein [Metabacillus litoralis]|uniref:DUF4306 domain-containing protein n=1 Tax=Metabacillus litoralis TaxID=152268 RepID=UPI001CFE40F5|nr:DUF4306 domain-containing protein [Metabacillus litoralis]